MTDVPRSTLDPERDGDELLQALYALAARSAKRAASEDLVAAVDALLRHEDEDVRSEALRILTLQWKDSRYRERALELLRVERSELVRGTAAYGIAALSTAATRYDDTRMLIGVVSDESVPNHVRGTSYEALLVIYRRRSFPPMTREFEPAVDVDWGWIEALRVDPGGGERNDDGRT